MGKFKDFIERNGKIIEVIFSSISLLIVGVIGTTISINNSITSKASLDLARANAQPAFNIQSEYNDPGTTESINIIIESGFAENISIKEYTIFNYYNTENGKEFSKKCLVPNYFETFQYSNNKGSIARLTKDNNFATYLHLLEEVIKMDKKSGLNRIILLQISYQDIIGVNITKYYRNNGGIYFSHVTEDEGEETLKTIEKLQEVDMDEITINSLIALPDTY